MATVGTIPIAPKHEVLIKSPILKESGGGILYRCSEAVCPRTFGLAYKHVKDLKALESLPKIFQILRDAAPMDIVRPITLVHDLDGRLTGFLMRDVAAAATLADLAELGRSATIPFVDVLGRVSFAMKAAAMLHLMPFVEHGGNVMLNLTKPEVDVSIIDVDGWIPSVGKISDTDLLGQLPMIFANYEGHADYNTFFVEQNSIVRVKDSFETIEDIILACSQLSRTLSAWFAQPTFQQGGAGTVVHHDPSIVGSWVSPWRHGA